jgi:DNA mismatch endonuclease, patch repair protein
VAVFVDGDFWHGRVLVEKGRNKLIKSFKLKVRDFWAGKIIRNVERDRTQLRNLRRNGWSVLRLWEKDILGDTSIAAASIRQRLMQRRAKLRLRLNAA